MFLFRVLSVMRLIRISLLSYSDRFMRSSVLLKGLSEYRLALFSDVRILIWTVLMAVASVCALVLCIRAVSREERGSLVCTVLTAMQPFFFWIWFRWNFFHF